MLAQVWRVDKSKTAREKEAQLRLVHIEFRIEKARRILQDIEQKATQAMEDVERAERRFETLRDSFTALQQEWKEWKKDQPDGGPIV